MGDLTNNLSRHEFACSCNCGSDFVDVTLPSMLQACVYAFKVRYPQYNIGIHINSGTRCRYHNAKVGGKSEEAGKPMSGSFHLYGMAVDFYLYDKRTGIVIDLNEVYEYLDKTYPENCGIGRYDGRLHFDNRPSKARWDNRSKGFGLWN